MAVVTVKSLNRHNCQISSNSKCLHLHPYYLFTEVFVFFFLFPLICIKVTIGVIMGFWHAVNTRKGNLCKCCYVKISDYFGMKNKVDKIFCHYTGCLDLMFHYTPTSSTFHFVVIFRWRPLSVIVKWINYSSQTHKGQGQARICESKAFYITFWCSAW